MAASVDLEDLPGQTIYDQDGRKIGKATAICDAGEQQPTWVTVDAAFSLMEKRTVFVPAARLKLEGKRVLVPYSIHHVHAVPDVDPASAPSGDADRALRDHYGIDRADRELRTDNDSYATRVDG